MDKLSDEHDRALHVLGLQQEVDLTPDVDPATAFLFAAKKPKNEGGQFAWQAGCPFHMRNAKTGCKKTMTVNPVTVENYKQVLTCLKHWCNQAPLVVI